MDISGSRHIDATDFVDTIAVCANLKMLIMQSCTQFSQWQLAKMIPNLKELRYLDLDRCVKILFPCAYCIVSGLPHLAMFNFVPGNAAVELSEWQRLYNIFFRVSFGISFKRILPHYGSYVHCPEDESSEE